MLLTIFTPTYNRRTTLQRIFMSLQQQQSKNFIWLIIDDGSTDGTCDMIEEWEKASTFSIKYIYKKNGGLSSAYNVAIEHLNTELAVCIDSDDYAAPNLIKTIETKWLQYGQLNNIAGLVGLDATPSNAIIGNRLQEGLPFSFLIYQKKEGNRADRKIVVRSDLYKQVAPVILYEDERGISPHILHMKICEKYEFVQVDEVLCIVDYQADGMSRSMWEQYYESPRSFADLRKFCLQKEISTFSRKAMHAIHYDSSCVLAHQTRKGLLKGPKKYLTWTLFPIGFILSRVVKYKYKQKFSVRKRKDG